MNIEAILDNYMNEPKWKGKIFMEDEKTCYKDGFNNGVNSCLERIEQLKEGNKQLAKRICELQSDLGKARETIKTMKTCPMLICHNCQQDCIANIDYSKDWIKNWEVKE